MTENAIELIDSLELLGDGSAFKEELCDMIESVQIFSDFTRGEVEIVAGYARAYAADTGITIFHEGQKGAFMCIIIKGKIHIYKETLERDRKRVITIRAGRTLGEMSIIDDLPHSATAITAEPVTLVMIPKYSFEKLTKENPSLGVKIFWKLARLMSLRLRQTTGILLDYL